MKSLNPRKSGQKGYSTFWPVVFLAPFFLCFFTFNLFPILYSVFVSFFNWDALGTREFVGLQNYINILAQDVNFLRSVKNTLYIMLLSFPFAILLGLVVAVFLSGLWKGRTLFQTLNFLPYITTPVAIGLLFSFLFDWNSGIVNRVIELFGIEEINWLGDGRNAPFVVAFMIVWKNTGYYMALYLAGITSISDELYEAARVDGATAWTIFWKITLPMLKPITIFILITSMISGLQLFDEPNTLFSLASNGSAVGGPDRSCLTVVWNFYDISFRSTTRLGYGSAVAFTLFLMIVVVSGIGIHFMNKGGKET